MLYPRTFGIKINSHGLGIRPTGTKITVGISDDQQLSRGDELISFYAKANKLKHATPQ
jgi:hypothetical protein